MKVAYEKPKVEKTTVKSDLELTNKEKVELYTLVLKSRMFDERFRKLFRAGRFAGTFFSGVGQEATTVVPCYKLLPQDFVGPSHRELGCSIARTPLKQIAAQIYARSHSPDKGKSHPCSYGYKPSNIITPAFTIAAQAVLATGVALAFKIRSEPYVALSFVGEGATAHGPWYEAINFSAVHKLPNIFVVQNNLWGESVPARLVAAFEDFSHRADGVGMFGVSIDGNDVLKVWETVASAIARARHGEGPTLIEMKTYRWYGHSEIDPADYRSKEEVETWMKKDPLPRYEKYLFDHKLMTPEEKKQIVAKLETEIEEAVDYAEGGGYAPPEWALEDVYADFKVEAPDR
ncbi:MAG: thiamine pyrophosphate-dependent dehydrogenase E1 component subunit alpha [Candidatus Zixiibacteriota bacterium]